MIIKKMIKPLIGIIQIPLTVIYFILSFFGSVISGLGWLFGVIVFTATIIFWIFGEFDTWYQIVIALGIAFAIVIIPGWLTEFLGEGVLFLKRILTELTVR